MTLLESVELGTPVLAREIETLNGLGFAFAGTEPEDVAENIVRFANDAEYRSSVEKTSLRSIDLHSSSVQRRALAYLYDVSPKDAA